MSAPCCTCRWWDETPKPESMPEAAWHRRGQCRIRSVPKDQFPFRSENDWCGEHQRRQSAESEAYVRAASERLMRSPSE